MAMFLFARVPTIISAYGRRLVRGCQMSSGHRFCGFCRDRPDWDGTAFNISGGRHTQGRAALAGSACATTRHRHQHLRGRGRRVADMDIDGHYGDGVRDAFYDGPWVLTISVHESGRLCRRWRRLSRLTSC